MSQTMVFNSRNISRFFRQEIILERGQDDDKGGGNEQEQW